MSTLNLVPWWIAFVISALGAASCGGSVEVDAIGIGAATGGGRATSLGGTGGLRNVGGAAIGGAVATSGTSYKSDASVDTYYLCDIAFNPGNACASPTVDGFAFDSGSGLCRPVTWNGCDYAGGFFTSLERCQAFCEQKPSSTGCPLTEPAMSSTCSLGGGYCIYGYYGTDYSFTTCLCTYTGSLQCRVPDTRCDPTLVASPRQCCGQTFATSDICTCAGGIWQCGPLTMYSGL